LLYLHCKRVGLLAIKDLVGPQHDDHFVFTNIGDVVRPARHRFDDAAFTTLGDDLVGFAGDDVAEAEMRLPLITMNFSVLVW
jgi:hypothetical protein